MKIGITTLCVLVLPSAVLASLRTREEASLQNKFDHAQIYLKRSARDLLFVRATMGLHLPPNIGKDAWEEIRDMLHEEETMEHLLKHKPLEPFSKYLIQVEPSTKLLNRSEWSSLFKYCATRLLELCYGFITTVPEFVDNYQNLSKRIEHLNEVQLYKLANALKRGVACEAINKLLNACSFNYFDFADHPIWNGTVGQAVLKCSQIFDIIEVAKYERSIGKIMEKEQGSLSEKLQLSLIFPEYASEILDMEYSGEPPVWIKPIEYKKLFAKLSPFRKEVVKSVDWENVNEWVFARHYDASWVFFRKYYDGWKENAYFDLSIGNIATPKLKMSYSEYLRKAALEEPQGAIYGMLQETVGFIGPVDYSSLEVDNVFEEHLWSFSHPLYKRSSAYRRPTNTELWYLYRKVFEAINSVIKDKMSLSRVSRHKYDLLAFLNHSIHDMTPDDITLVLESLHVHLSEMLRVKMAMDYMLNDSSIDVFLESFLNQFLNQCDPIVAYQNVIGLLKETFDFTTRAFLITCHARLAVRYSELELPLYTRPLFDRPLTKSMELLLNKDLFISWSANVKDAFDNMNLIYTEYDPWDFIKMAMVRWREEDRIAGKLRGDYETDVKMIVSSLDETLILRYSFEAPCILW